jgi:hypothetical protein
MADVRIIYLPSGEGGAKQGVDDFLAAGNSVEDLLSLAATELREPPQTRTKTSPPTFPTGPRREGSSGISPPRTAQSRPPLQTSRLA